MTITPYLRSGCSVVRSALLATREVLRKRDGHHTSTKFQLGVIRRVQELCKQPQYMTNNQVLMYAVLLPCFCNLEDILSHNKSNSIEFNNTSKLQASLLSHKIIASCTLLAVGWRSLLGDTTISWPVCRDPTGVD